MTASSSRRWHALQPPPHIRISATLVAESDAVLPGFTGSLLHGALGHALRELDGAEHFNRSPSYKGWLEPPERDCPTWTASGPPLPLVLRPPRVLGGERVIPAGKELRFEAVALRRDPFGIAALLEALARIGDRGLGRSRVRFATTSLRSRGRELLRDGEVVDLPVVEDAGRADAVPELAIETLTPLALRRSGQMVSEPILRDLVLAAARRLAAIRSTWGDPVPELQLSALADELSEASVTLTSSWRGCRLSRYSVRQRHRHPLHGVLGTAVFGGELVGAADVLSWVTPFGLGKNTSLGMGAFDLDVEAVPG